MPINAQVICPLGLSILYGENQSFLRVMIQTKSSISTTKAAKKPHCMAKIHLLQIKSIFENASNFYLTKQNSNEYPHLLLWKSIYKQIPIPRLSKK